MKNNKYLRKGEKIFDKKYPEFANFLDQANKEIKEKGDICVSEFNDKLDGYIREANLNKYSEDVIIGLMRKGLSDAANERDDSIAETKILFCAAVGAEYASVHIHKTEYFMNTVDNCIELSKAYCIKGILRGVLDGKNK